MPKWIHDRAEHILAKNPSMPKSQAFAIATQQSHAIGKSPKGYGTAEGRETAKKKYDTPHDDKKKANPGGLKSAKMEKTAMDTITMKAFVDEMKKIATALPPMHPRGMNAGVHTPAPAPGAPAARPAAGPAPAAPTFTGTLPPMHPRAKMANALCGPKMPQPKGSGTPVMPMPKTSGAFDAFMGGGGGKVSLPPVRQHAASVQPRLARQPGFSPAVVGAGPLPGQGPKPAPPKGKLNPTGGMH